MKTLAALIQRPVEYLTSLIGHVDDGFESTTHSSFSREEVSRTSRYELGIYDLSIRVNGEPALWVQIRGDIVEAYIHFEEGKSLTLKMDNVTKQFDVIGCDDLMLYYLENGRPIFDTYMML